MDIHLLNVFVRSAQQAVAIFRPSRLTAYARVEDRVMAIAAGFQMHIAKPVEPIELITMVAGARGLSIKSQAAAEQ